MKKRLDSEYVIKMRQLGYIFQDMPSADYVFACGVVGDIGVEVFKDQDEIEKFLLSNGISIDKPNTI